MKKYKLGFEVWGLTLFLLIMVPNLISFIFPASNDVLGRESLTPCLDLAASVFQIIFIALLCGVKNTKTAPLCFQSGWVLSCAACVLVYFLSWIIYYLGMAHSAVMLALCFFPCAAFLCFEADRKNYPAMVPTVLFAVLHLIYGAVNFVLR